VNSFTPFFVTREVGKGREQVEGVDPVKADLYKLFAEASPQKKN